MDSSTAWVSVGVFILLLVFVIGCIGVIIYNNTKKEDPRIRQNGTTFDEKGATFCSTTPDTNTGKPKDTGPTKRHISLSEEYFKDSLKKQHFISGENGILVKLHTLSDVLNSAEIIPYEGNSYVILFKILSHCILDIGPYNNFHDCRYDVYTIYGMFDGYDIQQNDNSEYIYNLHFRECIVNRTMWAKWDINIDSSQIIEASRFDIPPHQLKYFSSFSYIFETFEQAQAMLDFIKDKYTEGGIFEIGVVK